MIKSDRVSREKEWHNETCGTDVRAGVDKFYSIFPLLQIQRRKQAFSWSMVAVMVII